jgi:glycogen operon protein
MERNADMLRFVRGLIALRRRHPSLRRRRFLSGQPRNGADIPDVVWHGTRLGEPPWEDPQARVLAFALAPFGPGETALYIAINMSPEVQRFAVPRIPGLSWYRALDTGGVATTDVTEPADQVRHQGDLLVLRSRSVVALEGKEVQA